jgi:hypothetical protein
MFTRLAAAGSLYPLHNFVCVRSLEASFLLLDCDLLILVQLPLVAQLVMEPLMDDAGLLINDDDNVDMAVGVVEADLIDIVASWCELSGNAAEMW